MTALHFITKMNEIENIAEYIKEKADHRGWENAEYIAEQKFGEDKTKQAIKMLYEESVLDKFIEEKVDNINTIGITDPISEEYLKEICEEYFVLKTEII